MACALSLRHSGMTCTPLPSCSLFPSSIKPRFLSLSFSIAVPCSPFLSLAHSLYRSLSLFRSLSVSCPSHTPPLSPSAGTFACSCKQILAYTSRSHRVVHTCVCVCVCVCMCVRVCAYAYVCVSVCVYVYTHTHTHIYIYVGISLDICCISRTPFFSLAGSLSRSLFVSRSLSLSLSLSPPRPWTVSVLSTDVCNVQINGLSLRLYRFNSWHFGHSVLRVRTCVSLFLTSTVSALYRNAHIWNACHSLLVTYYY